MKSMLMSGGESDSAQSILQDEVFHSPWETLYKTVCVERPPEYSFYQTLDIAWGDQDQYEVVHKLGRGKYSEVYEGCNIRNN
jgi:hypothetical protein